MKSITTKHTMINSISRMVCRDLITGGVVVTSLIGVEWIYTVETKFFMVAGKSRTRFYDVITVLHDDIIIDDVINDYEVGITNKIMVVISNTSWMVCYDVLLWCHMVTSLVLVMEVWWHVLEWNHSQQSWGQFELSINKYNEWCVPEHREWYVMIVNLLTL
jgi:hypothetical protein